ncbi:hypothetical protein [Sporosarcina sp. ACRSL]|uniref:hypothetical protein n=1 Tax=Sporosarcina sp. ACRSL TaxID=2918215 RepID=UPI001EF5C4E9|nr:hypothetical protein [Sporosarcina sp. ACRSL]
MAVHFPYYAGEIDGLMAEMARFEKISIISRKLSIISGNLSVIWGVISVIS